MIEKSAMGEPKEGVYFALSANVHAYEITRWWDSGQEAFSVPRSDLPAGCDTARFFLNDSAHELQIAQPGTANEVFRDDKPVPIDSRVTLSHGRVRFPIANKGSLWTDADVECGLQAGDIVAICVKLRK